MAAAAANPARDEQQRRSEIYTYVAPWPIYAINWSVRNDKKYRLAICSLLEKYPNRVEIVQLDDSTDEIQSHPHLSFEHFFPATKSMFIPVRDFLIPDLLATSSDSLQIWRISDDRVNPPSIFHSKNSKFCAPLTSFDWNEFEYRRIGTSSIDTTCTIWDIERGIIDTQVIAHDKEVSDITWGGVEVFASASGDGSVRIFDLREKEHSTIIYNSTDPVGTPLVRVAWNKLDTRYMATIIMGSTKVEILDIRYPSLPVVELQGHKDSVNALAWDPCNSRRICTAGDDSQALIWDLSSSIGGSGVQQSGVSAAAVYGGQGPMLAYTAEAEIEQLQWSSMQPDWVAIAYRKKLQILQV